tara:strand:- start:337 stop:783 length:447 start_codon:yes stop_codon:yes gene_type:complete
MKNNILSSVIVTVIASVVSVAVTTIILSKQNPVESTVPDHPLVVVDFTNLSQRLMISMRDQITQQDMQLNKELIELLAQSEAHRLFKEVINHSPNAIVLNKSNIVNAPDSIDITNDIAVAMDLEQITEEAINEFISGAKVTKPVGVNQ